MFKLASVVNSAAAGLLECVETHGGSRRSVLMRSGLDHLDFERLDDRMPVAQFSRLIHEAALATDCNDISLRFARRYDIRRLGPVGYLLHHGETLAAALEDYRLYFHTLQSHTEITFEIEGSLAHVGYRVSDRLNYDKRHDAQFSTAIILYLAEQMCGRHWQLDGVEFEHERLRSCAYAGLLGTDNIDFGGRTNRFSFPAKLLEIRNRHADRQLTSILRDFLCSSRQQLAREDPLDQITETVATLVQQGKDARIEAVARFLGMSTRRVQRECERQRTTYSAIRSAAIMQFAAELVAHDTMPLTEIALLLGFSESSAFSRAFKNYMGMSPSRYRTNGHKI